jgi:DNA-binding FadR family transcriptional regulator
MPLSVPAIGELKSPHKASIRVARDLVYYICDGQLPEGTRLPPELEMQNIFGVGRTTLREALRILELRGVIVIRPGRGGGPIVRQPQTSDMREALALFLQFRFATLADVIGARIMLEPAVAAAAAEQISPTEVVVLRETVQLMLEDVTDEVTFSEQYNRFHSKLADAAGNPVIAILIDSLHFVGVGRSDGIEFRPQIIGLVARSHLEIVDAVERGDAELASAAMRRHLVDAKTYYARFFPEAYSSPLRWLESG